MAIDNLEKLNKEIKDASSNLDRLNKQFQKIKPDDKDLSIPFEKVVKNLDSAITRVSELQTALQKLAKVNSELAQKFAADLAKGIKEQASHAAKIGRAGGTATSSQANAEFIAASSTEQTLKDINKAYNATPRGKLEKAISANLKSRGVDPLQQSIQKRIQEVLDNVDKALSEGVLPKETYSIGGKKVSIKTKLQKYFKAEIDRVTQSISESALKAVDATPEASAPTPKELARITKAQEKESAAYKKQIRDYKSYGQKDLIAEGKRQASMVDDPYQVAGIRTEAAEAIRQFRVLGQTSTDINELSAALENARNKLIALGKEARTIDQKNLQALGEQIYTEYETLGTSPAGIKRPADVYKESPEAKNARLRQAEKNKAFVNKKDANLRQQVILQKALTQEEEKAAKAAEREAKARERSGTLSKEQVQTLKSNPKFDTVFKNAEALAAQYGRAPEEIQHKSAILGNTGITQFTSSFRDADGSIVTLRQTVDRFGKTLVDTQRRFRSFADGIRRDIKEFVQWSVAAGLVYGSFRKLQEVIQVAIKNEATLADITVVLGKNQADTNQIFQSAYDVAKKTGEGLQGVLEGYALAYRATGEYADITQRTAVTNQLMTDSLILSKLTTLSQAEALDTLAAALQQTNKSLDQGQQLLDQWVRVSRVANVSVTDLATSYAIVGEAAENAGISEEQLNALIATVAKTGIASGKELGNSVRAIVSGFQSEKAVTALNKYGIAIKDANGELKTTPQLIEEIQSKVEQGFISKDALNELTLAIGGGSRRQAVVATTIANYADTLSLVSNQTDTAGEAQKALDISLGTVQTAVEQLGNAFQKLAQTLGTDNGVLGAIKVLVNFLTTLVELLDKVTSFSGKSFVPLVSALGAFAYLSTGQNAGKNALSQFNQKAAMGIFGALNPLTGYSDQLTMGVPTLQQSRKLSALNYVSNNALAGIGAVGSVGITALSNLTSGNKEQAIANAVGGLVGGLVGSLTGPAGTMIGASIGSTIGETVVTTILEYKPQLADVFKPSVKPTETTTTTGTPTGDDTLKRLREFAFGSSGITQGIGGAFTTNLLNAMNSGLNAWLPNFYKGTQGGEFTGYSDASALLEFAKVLAATGLKSQDELNKIIADLQIAQQQTPEVQAAQKEQANQDFIKGLSPLIAKTVNEESLKNISELAAGNINVAEFGRRKTGIEGTQASLYDYLNNFGKIFGVSSGLEGIKEGGVIPKDVEEAVRQIYKLKELAPEEVIVQLNAYVATLNNATASEEDKARALRESEAIIKEFNKSLAQSVEEFGRVDVSKFTQADFKQKILPYLQAQLDSRLQQEADFSPTDLRDQDWVDQQKSLLETYFLKFSDTTDVEQYNPKIIELLSELNDTVLEQLGIMQQESIGLNDFSQYNQSDIARAAALSRTINAELKRISGGRYEGSIEDFYGLFKDGFGQEKADMKIMQLLLGKIEDNTKKQLDGIYNLPDAASFYFPSQVIPLIQAYGANQNGGADFSSLEKIAQQILDWIKNTTPMDDLPGQATPSEPKTYEYEGKITNTPPDIQELINKEKYKYLYGYGGPMDDNKEPSNPYFDHINQKPFSQVQQNPLKTFKDLEYSTPSKLGGSGGSGGGMTSIPRTDKVNVKSDLGLKFNINQNVNVRLDGKVIWSAIKPYARQDLLSFEGVSGSVTKSVSVAV